MSADITELFLPRNGEALVNLSINWLVRAKTEVVAAAIANGVVPAHNVTLDLKNSETTFADAKEPEMSLVYAHVGASTRHKLPPLLMR